MRHHFSISRIIGIFGVITAIGLGAVISTSIFALSELKIGGPLYNKIKLGNDLIADILPPPEYVIEAYLEATLALNDPQSLSTRRNRLAQLKREYDDRREFWLRSDLDPAIKVKLIDASDREVRRFWMIVGQTFLPALARADMVAAANSYSDVTAAYLAHRVLIDEIVKLANDDNAAIEGAATGRVNTFSLVLWGISGLVFLVIGTGIVGLARGVILPVTRMTGVMERLADGDLNVSIPALSRRDEVGAMAKAVQIFRDNSLRVEAMEYEQAALTLKVEQERKAAIELVAHGFETAIGNIVQAVSAASSEIELAARGLTKTAQTTQTLSVAAAAASEQSSASVNSAAAAADDMASSVMEIGRQVQEADRVACIAVHQAEQTNIRIAALSQSASRIGEVVKIITAVAEQTNLLALNAAIEAARAGDAGKGFAVVASEVKALAAQTAKATDEVSVQIVQMQSEMAQSVSAIEGIGGTIARISEISTTIAAAVEEQEATTRDISRNVRHAAQGATQATDTIADVNHGATDTGSAAEQVHGFARALLNESRHLDHEVQTFLTTIRGT